MVLLDMTQQSLSLNDGLTLSSYSVTISMSIARCIFPEYNQNQNNSMVKMAEVVADEF